jgi:hypothetical protein
MLGIHVNMQPKDPPDEVFERGGMKMIRRGRYVELKSHRSPHEQKELNRRMRESRPRILAYIEAKTNEFLEIVHKYSSLDLIANLFLRDGVQDPDKYVESDSQLRPHWVEHAAVLELRDACYTLRRPLLVEGGDLERAHHLLEDIFSQTVWYYIAESADPEREGPLEKIDELRFTTMLHGMSVRSPAYASHWRDLLLELFGHGSAIEHLSTAQGLEIHSVLRVIDAIEEHITSTLGERFQQARRTYQDLSDRLKVYQTTGVFSGDEEEKALLDRVRNMRNKEATRYLKYALIEWTRVALGTVLSFTVEQISELAKVSLEHTRALLSELSTQFGATPSNYVLPAPVNILHERPIVHHERGEFCPAPHLLPWSIKPALERMLKETPYWEAYQRQRSTYLIRTALKYLINLLPGATAHEGLYYPLKGEGDTDLDGLLFFDRYAFLVEAKAGALGAARRGGKPKIKTQLEALVGDAADQVSRARDYIHSVDEPVFRLKTGARVLFDKRKYPELVLMTVTLDVLDIFTAEMYQMRDIGIITTHDLPWSVALTDLRAISEIIARSFEFTHYLHWRFSMIEDSSISAGPDELNWLAIYLKEGPRRLKVPDDYKQLSFTSYTDDFDAYFLYQEGQRTIPAPRPAQPLPSPMNLLCDSLALDAPYGFTALGESLLDLDFSERERFAQHLTEFSFWERKTRRRGFVMETETLVVKVVPGNLSDKELSEIARVLHQSGGRRALALCLSSLPTWHIVGWAATDRI